MSLWAFSLIGILVKGVLLLLFFFLNIFCFGVRLFLFLPLPDGCPLHTCMRRASTAGTIACTAVGAQAGVPTREVLDERSSRDGEPAVTGNWGPGGAPGVEYLEAPGLSWGREK